MDINRPVENPALLDGSNRGMRIMEKEIDETAQCYERFLQILRQMSMDAKEQINLLKGTVVADELANDFSEIAMMCAEELLENEWLTREQFMLAKSIDEMLDVMSERKELWTEEALRDAEEWKKCREKGKLLLSMME